LFVKEKAKILVQKYIIRIPKSIIFLIQIENPGFGIGYSGVSGSTIISVGTYNMIKTLRCWRKRRGAI
jgi:hypothetical protein